MLPLECHAAVDAENGQRTRLSRLGVVGEGVARPVEPELGCDPEEPVAVRVAGRGVIDLTPAADQTGLLEIHHLAEEVQIEAAHVVLRCPQRELRDARVRWSDRRRIRVLQRLELLDPPEKGPPVAVVGERPFARQIGLRGGGDVGRQVREIRVVGHALEVQVAPQPVREPLAVLQRPEPTRFVQDPIIGQIVEAGLAAEARLEVAKLVVELQPAARHQARRNGVVAVGCDVPVERRLDLESGVVAGADERRQEAGLAPTGQGEVHPGRVEDRDVLEVHARIARHAHVGEAIEVHPPDPQVPIVFADRAVGVGGPFRAVDVPVHDHQTVGLAAGPELTEVVGRMVDVAGRGVEVVVGPVAGDHVAEPVDTHVAGGGHGILGNRVVQLVGGQDLAPAAHDYVANRLQVLALHPLDAIGLDEDGQLFARTRCDRRQKRLLHPERQAHVAGSGGLVLGHLPAGGRQDGQPGDEQQRDSHASLHFSPLRPVGACPTRQARRTRVAHRCGSGGRRARRRRCGLIALKSRHRGVSGG